MSEQVKLILGDDCVVAIKKDLVSKSQYFASLLSTNFMDHLNPEQHIKYTTDVETLQTFVNWVSDDGDFVAGDYRQVKPSLRSFVKDDADVDGLLQLLQLATFFAAEDLIRDVTDLLACRWLIPSTAIRVWLWARVLSIASLQDLAKAVCITCARDLPEASLLELSGEDIIELLGNVCVHPCAEFPGKLLEKWVQQNIPPGEKNTFEEKYPFTLLSEGPFDPVKFEETHDDQLWNNSIQCVVCDVSRELTEDTASKSFSICGWDGNTFSEILDLSGSPRELRSFERENGVRITGRGFDIFFVEGKADRNAEISSPEIWRYSMISKSWYYVTCLPRPRYSMTMSFIKEKLIFVGGTDGSDDKNRCDSYEVYNIYTGKWSQTSYVPHMARKDYSVSLSCEINNSLVVYECLNRHMATYDPDNDMWENMPWPSFFHCISDKGEITRGITPCFIMTHSNCSYMKGITLEESRFYPFCVATCRIFIIEDFQNLSLRLLYKHDPVDPHLAGRPFYYYAHVSNGPYLITFTSARDLSVRVEVLRFVGNVSRKTIAYMEPRSDALVKLFSNIKGFGVLKPRSLNELF